MTIFHLWVLLFASLRWISCSLGLPWTFFTVEFDLGILILLPPPPKRCDYRCVPPHSTSPPRVFFFLQLSYKRNCSVSFSSVLLSSWLCNNSQTMQSVLTGICLVLYETFFHLYAPLSRFIVFFLWFIQGAIKSDSSVYCSDSELVWHHGCRPFHSIL